MTEDGSGKVVKLGSGRSLYVVKHDREPSASGPDIPIIIIHGMTCTTRSWLPTLPFLKRHTVILYDSQGHGRTPSSSSVMSVQSFAEDTHDVLAYFGYKSAYVVGHSLGAYNAVNFTQSYPDETNKLILVCPCIIPMPVVYRAWSSMMRSMPMEELLDTYYYQWLGSKGKTDPAVLKVIREETEAHEQRREEQARYHEMAMQSFEFKTLHGVEAWVIIGTEDSVTTPEQCRDMCKYMKAKSAVVEAGHYPNLENPRALSEVILSIIDAA